MDTSSRFAVNSPAVIFDTQGDETVVIDLETGHYFRLDGASTALWGRLVDGATGEELIASCSNGSVLAEQLPGIIAELQQHSLIKPAGTTSWQTDGPWEFAGFTLEQFTDLEDILGLDPIHEVDPELGWPHTKSD